MGICAGCASPWTRLCTDFSRGLEVGERFSEWTPTEIVRFNSQATRWGQSTADWYCRPTAPPIKGLQVHTRTWRDNRWKPLTSSRAALIPDSEALGVEIDGEIYVSMKTTLAHGQAGYFSTKLSPDEYTIQAVINRPPIVSLDGEPIMTEVKP